MRKVVIHITVMLGIMKKNIEGVKLARPCDLCQVADCRRVALLPQTDILAGHAHQTAKLGLVHAEGKPDDPYAVEVIFYRHEETILR